jgi:hypothetical protein
MIIDCFKSILIRKYNGYKIYIHNLGNFDIIFLLKYLVKISIINPVIHNGKIISINAIYGKNNEYQVQFKDSMNLLPSSLLKLGKAFGVSTVKSIFPFLFINKNNLNYIGEVPEMKFFPKINKKDYDEYRSKFDNSN